jgi:predicted mannosyl-3-phosphoglycerate phosphatase (HAD superfamily)
MQQKRSNYATIMMIKGLMRNQSQMSTERENKQQVWKKSDEAI